jgi:hypothetical protein
MKAMLILLALVLPVVGAAYLAFYVPSPIKIVRVSTPDPRYTDLDARVKTLEDWAEKRGRRY